MNGQTKRRRLLLPALLLPALLLPALLLPAGGCFSSSREDKLAAEAKRLQEEVKRLRDELAGLQRQLVEARTDLLAAPKDFSDRAEQLLDKRLSKRNLHFSNQLGELQLRVDRLERALREKGALPPDWKSIGGNKTEEKNGKASATGKTADEPELVIPTTP